MQKYWFSNVHMYHVTDILFLIYKCSLAGTNQDEIDWMRRTLSDSDESGEEKLSVDVWKKKLSTDVGKKRLSEEENIVSWCLVLSSCLLQQLWLMKARKGQKHLWPTYLSRRKKPLDAKMTRTWRNQLWIFLGELDLLDGAPKFKCMEAHCCCCVSVL